MGLVQTAAPAIEPVPFALAKQHLRLDDSDDDELVAGLIAAARQDAEAFTRRVFITQTWVWTFDRFPTTNIWLDVPLAPLQSVTSITYTDTAGAGQTWPSSNYIIDTTSSPGRIALAYGAEWPLTRRVANAVTVTFVAGYGSTPSAVPHGIRQAILLHVGALYDGQCAEERSTPDSLPACRALLWPYRVLNAV